MKNFVFGLLLGLLVVGTAVSDPASASLLATIKSEVLVISASIKEYVKEFNGYVKLANDHLEVARNAKKLTDSIKSIQELYHMQSEQLNRWADKNKVDGDLFSMKFREFDVDSQVAAIYFRDLTSSTDLTGKKSEEVIDKYYKGKSEAEKAKARSAVVSGARISAESYDSMLGSKIVALRAKKRFLSVGKSLDANKNLTDEKKAEAFALVTARVSREVEVEMLEQQIQTNRLLTALLQTLTTGVPAHSSKPFARETGIDKYEKMQGVRGR